MSVAVVSLMWIGHGLFILVIVLILWICFLFNHCICGWSKIKPLLHLCHVSNTTIRLFFFLYSLRKGIYSQCKNTIMFFVRTFNKNNYCLSDDWTLSWTPRRACVAGTWLQTWLPSYLLSPLFPLLCWLSHMVIIIVTVIITSEHFITLLQVCTEIKIVARNRKLKMRRSRPNTERSN